MKIAIFYHCLFYSGETKQLMPDAVDIIRQQMEEMQSSGLTDAADHICIGINGGEESEALAWSIFPEKSVKVMHGLDSRAENLTLVEIEKWVKDHPDWFVLYFHSKGATHSPDSGYGQFAGRWRRCMMRHLVSNWRQCAADMSSGIESVGCHWMTGLCDGTQNIWAGNFWWCNSSFLASLPSIFERDRIKVSGISALESRYEAEVWIGNGKRLPSVRDYHPGGLGNCP